MGTYVITDIMEEPVEPVSVEPEGADIDSSVCELCRYCRRPTWTLTMRVCWLCKTSAGPQRVAYIEDNTESLPPDDECLVCGNEIPSWRKPNRWGKPKTCSKGCGLELKRRRNRKYMKNKRAKQI